MSDILTEIDTDFKKERSKKLKKVRVSHKVLNQLLKQIKKVDFYEVLAINKFIETEKEDKKQRRLSQKEYTVGVIESLLKTAEENQWNLVEKNASVWAYNNQYWEQVEEKDLKFFLGRVAERMGVPKNTAKHYKFERELLNQFYSKAYLGEPPLDTHTTKINLLNGTIQLNGKVRLKDFDHRDFLRYQLPFAYNPDAQCTMFFKYLNDVLPDENSQKILQEFIGYIFSPLKLEKMLVCYGSGGNGKSVLFDIINALLGEEMILTYALDAFNSEYNRAKLDGKLLNYSSEKGANLNNEILKKLISGEPEQARLPHKEPFTLRNKVRFIINANKLPENTEQTNAYFRRFLIVPFEQTISEEKKDVKLAEKIIKNELAGVFNWMLEGLKRLNKNERFSISEKVSKALDAFKKSSDSTHLFIEEKRFIPTDSTESADFWTLKDLYQSYKTFCEEDGYRPLGKKNFSIRFEKTGFTKNRNGKSGSYGFYLKEDF